MNIFETDKQLFLSTYNRIPIELDYAKGIYLFDKKGNKYYDFFSGLAVNALGYSHPKIIEEVTNQINLFAHLSNNFITDIQIKFSEKLLKFSEMNKLFLTNSGTEAVEAAIKLIRLKSGPDKIIYSLSNSFHGRTYGALTLTAREKYRNGFEPLLPNTGEIKLNDCEDLKTKVNSNTAAVFLEFIQGEGGINEISDEFVNELFYLKAKHNFFIVADEIQAGIGRTGKPFSFNYFNVKPDIIITAKAIGGGLPLGAMLVTEQLTDVFTVGKHGTTFGGNPVCCAAGLVVLNEVFENGLMNSVFNLGNYFKENLLKIKEKYPDKIKDVRGKGFMLGVELNGDGNVVVKEMLKRNILTNCTNQNVIRILPPLITLREEINCYLSNFEDVIKKHL